FVERHKQKFDSRYLNILEPTRSKNASRAIHTQFLNIVSQKMHEYKIKVENICNVLKEVFMIEKLQKCKGLFPRELCRQGRMIEASQYNTS
ncbi:MAG: hypothetical protein FE78DRAFT_141018, partial [Acidomyces sp. 'richmondensis']